MAGIGSDVWLGSVAVPRAGAIEARPGFGRSKRIMVAAAARNHLQLPQPPTSAERAERPAVDAVSAAS